MHVYILLREAYRKNGTRDPYVESGTQKPPPGTFTGDPELSTHRRYPGHGTFTCDSGPGTLHLGPFTWDPGPYMWEPGPNTFTWNVEPILRNLYNNTALSLSLSLSLYLSIYLSISLSLNVQFRSANRELHKFVQHDRRIDYAKKNIIVYLPFWLCSWIFKNHKLA